MGVNRAHVRGDFGRDCFCVELCFRHFALLEFGAELLHDSILAYGER